MKKELNCYDLGIEVGRMCPCRCSMCLRGEEEDVTIDVGTVKRFLREFSYIGNITFSGGEPTLYETEIIEIIDYIIENNIAVGGFYVATSGLFKVPNLMLKLAEFYAYVSMYNYENYSSFELSNDSFHPSVPPENKMFFKSFSFFSERMWADKSSGWIPEGRALDVAGIKYSFPVDYNASFGVEDEDDESVTYGRIYLNALGYVLPDCNYSYESQRRMNPFAYGSMPLEKILETYNQSTNATEEVA